MSYEEANREKQDPANPIPQVPPDPVREELRPVLKQIFHSESEYLPDVLDDDIEVKDEKFQYELTPGVLSTIRVKKGLSKPDKVRAIMKGVAEADSWAFRKKSRRDYASQIEKVKYGFGDDQKDQILHMYSDLKLLSFFASEEASAAIEELPADVKGPVAAMQKEFLENKEEIWKGWMDVKMYARRVVAGDEPFRSVLRTIKKQLGREEPPPRTWLDSVGPEFKEWAAALEKDEKLFIILTNLKELRERVEFTGDTHGMWLVEGSPDIPEKAKDLKPGEEPYGVAVLREDLGGGYNDLTFVFSKKLKGDALKGAFLYSLIFRQLLSDFQMLATAGGDFAKKDEDGMIDRNTSIVPDKYDPLYAHCGGVAALDTLLKFSGSKYPLLSGVRPKNSNPDKILKVAHDCVIDGARGDIKIPDKDDEFDVEGPAPGSRLALFQMLARFEDIDTSAMAEEAPKTAEDEKIEDLEAKLKAIKKKQASG
ncbi:MAG: hypothetical protein H6713_19045 [Myxococcales bacterium]|nr:hypothetical protein [Myxococcales bacterium]MCB9752066.1 hypothetical protein [Myxococcales bacterium]